MWAIFFEITFCLTLGLGSISKIWFKFYWTFLSYQKTLAGTLVLNILMTFTGFSSLTTETGRPAAGFSVLFSSVALCIMATLIYIILRTDVPREEERNVSKNQLFLVTGKPNSAKSDQSWPVNRNVPCSCPWYWPVVPWSDSEYSIDRSFGGSWSIYATFWSSDRPPNSSDKYSNW